MGVILDCPPYFGGNRNYVPFYCAFLNLLDLLMFLKDRLARLLLLQSIHGPENWSKNSRVLVRKTYGKAVTTDLIERRKINPWRDIMKHTAILLISSLGFMTLLVACGIEDQGWEVPIEGKADINCPEEMTWAPDKLPLCTCTLENDSISCVIDENFNKNPSNISWGANHELTVTIQTSPTLVLVKNETLRFTQENTFPLDGAFGKIKVTISGQFIIPHTFHGNTSGVSINFQEYELTATLSEEDPKKNFVAPYDIWRVNLHVEDASQMPSVHLKMEYDWLNSAVTGETISLNPAQEVRIFTAADSGISGKLTISGSQVEIPSPGNYLVTLEKKLRLLNQSDCSF